MPNRFFLCYREDSADFAKHLSEHINKQKEVYGEAYYSDYHAHGNYLSMEQIGRIFDEVEYFVCCAGRDIVKGFFLPSGEFNKECATALEFVSAEKRRQKGEIKFIIINYNNYEFSTEDLAILEKLYREFGILREDSVDAIKNANRNYYDKRQTDTEMFYSRLLRGLELIKQESQEDVIRKIIEERLAQMVGASTVKTELDELERLKKENEKLKKKLTDNTKKASEDNVVKTKSATEDAFLGSFNLPKREEPLYSASCEYNAPPITLLTEYKERENTEQEELDARVIDTIESTLKSFSIKAKVIGVRRSAQYVQYEISLASGVSINKVRNLKPDLQIMIGAKRMRLLAPIPGKTTVAIEIPTDSTELVGIRSIIESDTFKKSKGGIQIALGKSIDGVEVCDLSKLPHLLVAGAIGSGKSTLLDAMIVSLIYKHSPEEVRLALVDVDGIDFAKYKGVPHMLFPDVIRNSEHAVDCAKWLTTEITRRYDLLRVIGKRNIEDYNALIGRGSKLARIVFIVNECASITGREKEWQDAIAKIAQVGRAVGVHLVVTTQRPTTTVIPGMLKVNVPARIALATATSIDSMVIMDVAGAEDLMGNGDMLFNGGMGTGVKRIQGAYITEEEIDAVRRYVIANNDHSFEDELWGKIAGDKELETTLYKAMRVFLKEKTVSVSLLQRKLYLGYMRASKCVDELEKRGFIERNGNSGTYKILITLEDFKKYFG